MRSRRRRSRYILPGAGPDSFQEPEPESSQICTAPQSASPELDPEPEPAGLEPELLEYFVPSRSRSQNSFPECRRIALWCVRTHSSALMCSQQRHLHHRCRADRVRSVQSVARHHPNVTETGTASQIIQQNFLGISIDNESKQFHISSRKYSREEKHPLLTRSNHDDDLKLGIPLTLLVAGGLFLSTPRVFLKYLPNGLS